MHDANTWNARANEHAIRAVYETAEGLAAVAMGNYRLAAGHFVEAHIQAGEALLDKAEALLTPTPVPLSGGGVPIVVMTGQRLSERLPRAEPVEMEEPEAA